MNGKTKIQSVARACMIIQLLSNKKGGLSNFEISNYLGLNRSTTYHLVSTLQEYGFIAEKQNNKYTLGDIFFEISNNHSKNLIFHIVHENIQRIVRNTKETTYFSLFQNNVHTIDIVVGEGALRVVQSFPSAKEPHNLHARSTGKLYLSTLDNTEIREFLNNQPLEKLTENTIVNEKEFMSELEKIRKQGYAEDLNEFWQGVMCFAYPIKYNGKIIGCLSSSLPSARQNNYITVKKEIIESVNRFENLLDDEIYSNLMDYINPDFET